MKTIYFSESRTVINHPQRKSQKRHWILSVVLFCLFAGLPQVRANIFDDWYPEHVETNNQFGYIELKIPIYEDEGEQTYATGEGGWASISANGTSILEFRVPDGSGDKLENVEFQVRGTDAGKGRVRVRRNTGWALIENNTEVTMTYATESKSNIRVGYLHLRYYPPALSDLSFSAMVYVVRTTISDPGWKTYTFANKYKLSEVTYSASPTFTQEWTLGTTAKQVQLKASIVKGTAEINAAVLKCVQWEDETAYETLSYSGNNASSTRSVSLTDANKDTHATKKVSFYWKQDIPDTYSPLMYETYSGTVTIPAYNQANNISGTYDQVTGTITLNWTINTSSHSNSNNFISQTIGGDFEIQRSTTSNFSQNVKDFPVTFATNKSSYSLTDEIPDLSNNTTFYYRIRRSKPTGWNTSWENNFYSIGSVGNISIARHATVSSPSMMVNTELGEAVITWNTVSGYWSPGSQLVIEKYNETAKTALPPINLDKDAFEGKQYTDVSLSVCNEYSYKIYVKPGQSFYTTQTAIAVPGTAVINDIGEILDFKTSKGYYSDRTSLEWTTEGSFDEFIIKRMEYGGGGTPQQIATVPATLSDSYIYDDVRGTAGVYYKYIITGVASCNNKQLETAATEDVGFRTPTGNIYGRVTFSSGQPVGNVEILLASDLDMGYSLNLKNNVVVSVPDPKEISNDDFTFQTWFMSENTTKPSDQLLFHRAGQYEVGFDDSGNLYFKAGTETLSSSYMYKKGEFLHISAVKAGNTLKLYMDTTLIKEEEKSSINPAATAIPFFLGSNGTAKRFIGYIDEVRVWNRALERDEIMRDYTRLIVGNEPDLIAYYRFNETMDKEFYDISFVRTKYNENHGTISDGYAGLRSSEIPENLGLKGITDNSGDYYINGVPYEGNGTQYKVVPRKGTHQFDPEYRLRNLSDNELTVEANFTDKSSFKVGGTIYYENSNIPVQGVGFKIDGTYVGDGKGGMAQTNVAGVFSIEVPVGVHTVEAVKDGHTFSNDGKILKNGVDVNYQDHMSGVEIRDITKIRFIGRVAGGAVQGSYKIGHSLSKNNLGDDLKVKLKLEDGYQFDFSNPEEVTLNHLIPSNQTDNTSAQSRVRYEKNVVYIYPDKNTGEFHADLIPFRFIIDSISAVGHDNDILKREVGTLTLLDLQNSVIEQNELYEYTDSVSDGKGGYNYFNYSDTVKYHYKEQYIKRVAMEIDFYQLAKNGSRAAYFGEEEIEFSNLFGDTYTVPVYTNESYLFKSSGNSIPVYLQGHQYNYVATASEVYRYNGGNEKLDRVPCIDGSLIINNRLAVENPEQTIRLNSEGYTIYSFVTGIPDMGSTATKSFNARIKLSNNDQDAWEFEGNETMNACIIGSKSKGNDFVTNGPNQLITVLRDPPGSNSFAYLEKGTVITSSTTDKHGVSIAGEEDIRAILSPEFKSAAGTPFFLMVTEIKLDNNIGAIISHEESSYDGITTTKRTTLQTRFETSSDPLYVGRDGDLLIGNSTNIVYGICDAYVIVEIPYSLSSGEELIFDAGTHKLIRRSTYNSDVKFNTLFAYPQIHIENRLIPELVNLKNSFLKYGEDWTPSNAQLYADMNDEIVYVSHYAPEEKLFGYSNNDQDVFGDRANKTSVKEDGPSYQIFYPKQMPVKQRTDTILQLCSSIQNWYDLLAQNEQSKLKAKKLHKNYSFHAGSQIEYSEEYAFETETTYEFEYFVNASAVLELGATFNGVGFKTTFTEGGGKKSAHSTSDIEEYTRKEGFVLSEDGDDDYISVDVYYEETENLYEEGTTGLTGFAKGPFIYRTKGGVTSCPYEGVRLTKYYQPGTILDEATVKLEVPVLSASRTSVSNVPQMRPAVFTLYLENQSEAKEDNYFTLAVLDGSNPYGAKLSIDGQALSNTGRAFLVPYGEPLAKTLELRVGADSMKYENIQLILRSQCQYDPTDFVEDIADTISLSAYFIPSCSDINVKVPLENFIVNTQSPMVDGVYQLPIILDGYDANNMSLDRIEIQMKQESESEWLIVQTYYTDPDEVNNPLTEAEFDRTKSEIKYNLPMSRYDSRYQIRAVSVCIDGVGEIPTYSSVITGTKDTERPKLFGSPQPANGILDVEGEIRINFNETIKEGALSNYNFQVTGIKNGSNKSHGVSVELDGINDYLITEADRNFVDRDLTLEMWVYREKGSGSGTLFSHGNINNSLELGFTSDDKLVARINGNTLISGDLPFESGTQWAHIAIVYSSDEEVVSLFYNTVNVLNKKTAGKYTGDGIFEFGRSMQTSSDYFAGKIHETRLWSKQLSTADMKINWLKIYSGLESGMIAYYPMQEGKGKIAYDKVRGANATMYAEWSTQESHAVSFDGNGILIMPSVEISKEMDYTLELWFKAREGQTNTTLLTNELKQVDNNAVSSNPNRFFLGFNGNGKLLFRSNQHELLIEDSKQIDYRDNNWHHVAVSVNRITRRVETFIDGNLIKQFGVDGIEGISADAVTAGAERICEGLVYVGSDKHFIGSLDEIRFWNGAFSEDLINNNCNIRLNGDEMGLLAYYPFEKYQIESGVTALKYTLDNQAISEDPIKASTSVNVSETSNTAPIKDRGPVENLAYNFVVSDKSLIINLDEDMDVIEKSSVIFSVKEVSDMFGNQTISPIIWSAYIDRNLLKWSTDEVNLSNDRGQDLAFEVDIVNNGGSIERFSLENLPLWLTASPLNGSISPKAKQTICFTVDDGVNVGRYQEMIFMRNSKNVVEMLGINLKIEGEKPDWNVNPADYEHNMAVFGKLRINGIFSSDKEDVLAAFINGKCVGITTNNYQEKTNTWYTFLTVYGNRDMAGAEVEFRIWDASTGVIYGAETTQTIVFKNQQINGTAEKPLIFDSSDLIFQNIKLNSGWNWISFRVSNSLLNNVQATLSNGTWNRTDIVKDNDYFDSYSAASKSWTGTLSNNGGFDNVSMFMLNASNSQTLSIIGKLLDLGNTPISVKGNKWNLISYLPEVTMSVDEALADYDAKSGDVIKSQNVFAMFNGHVWIGSLSYLEPNKGYMLLRNDASNTSFKYPVKVGLRNSAAEEQVSAEANCQYANNMTMTAVVNDIDLRDGDRLLAFMKGELRGVAARTGDNDLNYINISSDEEGFIDFAIERNGQIIARSNTRQSYMVNKVAGNLKEPIKLDFSESGDEVSVYPNPFVTDLTIRIVLGDGSEVGIVIADISGRLVKQWPIRTLESGTHLIEWDESTIADGQYIVTITINGNPSSYKVIKK